MKDFDEVRLYARQWAEFEPPPIVNKIVTEQGWEIVLWSYGIDPKPVIEGATLQIDLYWRIDNPLPSDKYGVFMHLRDQTERTVAQADWHFLTGGRFPEVTHHVVSIPPAVSGDYSIKVGVYRPDTLERMEVIGDISGENSIVLGNVMTR